MILENDCKVWINMQRTFMIKTQLYFIVQEQLTYLSVLESPNTILQL